MNTLNVDRKDVGYTVCSRLEQALRSWLSDRLLVLEGDKWRDAIPRGLLDKATERNAEVVDAALTEPAQLLEELDLPDIWEVAAFKKSINAFLDQTGLMPSEFQQTIDTLYGIRIKIAHVKQSFTAVDLDLLIDCASRVVSAFPDHCQDLAMTLECLQSAPDKVVVKMPPSFVSAEELSTRGHVNNLPPSDYASDGGFVGRKDDLARIQQLITGNLHRVVTIAGAGGVGKSALAHKLCSMFLSRKELPFDAIVWVSAKEEQLSDMGIEPLEPSLRSYEDVLDAVLDTYKWDSDGKTLEEKEHEVEIIFTAGAKGVLLVVDNLETIRDAKVREYLKDCPPPSKVLITSRIGLGEVERRVSIKELKIVDAVTLLRTVAREKGARDLMSSPDAQLKKYVNRMARYPLAIKWVVGQVALGQDINVALGGLTSSTGDVARFCFEHIFEHLLSPHATTVMFALAAVDHAVTRGVLAHLADMPVDELDDALRDLSLASLIVTMQEKRQDDSLETQYELLSLTRNYVYARLRRDTVLHAAMRQRAQGVEELIAEASAAQRGFGSALTTMAAVTAEEKIAAMWAATAFQKAQGGDYDGAVTSFQRAADIAPNFAPVLRSWAQVEAFEGFYERADELMKHAVTLAPSDWKLWVAWGNLEKRRARYDKAAEYVRRAGELAPSEVIVKGVLGEIEKRRGNFEVAYRLLAEASGGGNRMNQIVCLTTLADNQRRWAEVLRSESDEEGAQAKLQEAYEYAKRAVDLAPNDEQALDAFRRVSLDFGLVMRRVGKRDLARPLLEGAVTQKPRRHKQRRTTQVACYYLAKDAVECGDLDRARSWLSKGRRSLTEGPYKERYRKLSRSLSEVRSRGRLISVVPDRGFGFLEDLDSPGGSVLLHVNDVVPSIRSEQLEELVQREFSYIVESGKNGPKAVTASLVG